MSSMTCKLRAHGTIARMAGLVAVALTIFAMPAGEARADLELDLTQGRIQPMPIALPNFVGKSGKDAQLGQDIIAVVTNNLRSSGLFQPLDQASYIEKINTFGNSPRFGDWRIINAQALVTGQITIQGDGRLKAEFRLWDVFGQKKLLEHGFLTTPGNWRRVGHLISDEIYKRLTGEKGYFDTRIVFIEESGPKENRVKRLAIMDQDGHNFRRLTNGNDLVLTPRFSPNQQEITYMSYRGDNPSVYLFNIETGQQEAVGKFPGMTFAPRFSPDGQRVVMSLSRGVHSNIYSMDLRTRKMTRLTNTAAIDTSPSYSPDGRQITFSSDRAGGTQIYVMNADGSNQRRITFGKGRYSTPVWSPRGDLIAFTKITSGKFLIGVMRPDGSRERVLTEGRHNEGPTWAPNGRVLMFFRETGGPTGGPKLWMVDLTGHNERKIETQNWASDPAWSPLIN